jgi:hypothetical protein
MTRRRFRPIPAFAVPALLPARGDETRGSMCAG